jgi:4-nitrophenyl phosphatase
MDGVLYRGDTPLPGAQALVDWLTEREFPFVLLTNNSTLDSLAYERRLAEMGIHVPAGQIITSASAAADYLAGNCAPGCRVLIVGESGLQASVAARGLKIVEEDPEVVLVGMDRHLTYAKLATAALAIRAGARFIATNPDRTLPTEAGEAPGAGAIVAALVAATDQTPLVIGKPEPAMLELALARLATPPERTAMLGDRLETDILGGQRVGMLTILVLSGATKEAPPSTAEIRPTWVFSGLPELLTAWQRSLMA